MERICLPIALLVFFSIHATRQESLCNKPSRPPPAGCCPSKYIRQCCPITGDNETVYACPSKSFSRSGSSTRSDRAIVSKRSTYKFDYRTDCVHRWRTQACVGGVYLNVTNGKPEACPAGFFCPANLLCLIPCPSGAYCIPKKKQNESSTLKCRGFGVCCGKNDPPLILNISKGRKCKGLHDTNCICRGRAAPIPCPAGYYCPAPDVKLPCDSGHYCRPGSIEPDRCPWLTKCDEQSSAPITNFIAALLDVIVLFIFLALVIIYKNWGRIKAYCRECFPATRTKRFYGDDELDQASFTPKSYRINIAIEDLTMTVKSGETKEKVVLLKGVTGHIRSGEVTAIMGPSGAGKTSFLNALSGKAHDVDKTGSVLFNNVEVKGIKQFRSITGFVPQEDIMHRNLTVSEVLYYQAMLRLPVGIRTEGIKKKINQTLSLLKIPPEVADSLIGDNEKRGISGGERKRVNIGMELIADPTLLFLDEPTSGLDSTTSLSVLECLRTVAERGGLTVVCVIHQPRFEIFEKFHNIFLFGAGGKTVYQGSVGGAAEHFESLGFQPEPKVNPADYYMDIIGGSVRHEGVDLFKEWEKRIVNQERENGEKQEADVRETRVLPNPIDQFLTFTKREFKLQERLVKILLIDAFLVFFAGGVLGALYLEVTLGKFTGLTRMSGMAIGLTTMLSSLRCFGNYNEIFWRESAAGVNRLSYFLAVNFVQIPILVMMPLVYLSLLYTLSSPRSYFSAHYAAVFCAQLCCSGIGYAMSLIFTSKSSQMASVVVVLVMAMVSGASPTLCKLDEMEFFGPLGYNLSFIRWFVEALFEKEALRYPDVARPHRDSLAFRDNYTLDGNYPFCLGVLVIMAFVYRLIALVLLFFSNRKKQQ